MADSQAKPEKDTDSPEFATQLATIRPAANIELGEALADLVQHVKDTGKPGRLTYAIEIKPVNGSQTVVSVTDKITVKNPEKDRVPSLAYTDSRNRLSRNDPQSSPLFDMGEDIKTADIDLQTGEIKDPPRS